jgi:3-methyladenine DNA glycosylase AlkD
MDRAKLLVEEIRSYCAEHENPELAVKYARYFREGYASWGLMDDKLPFWGVKLEEWFERYRGLGLPGFLRFGTLEFRTGKYEEGGIAIRFVSRYLGEFERHHLDELGKWFESGIANWAHTDVLCSVIMGPLLERGRLDLDAIESWRRSEWKYQRRAVPVAMLNLLKKGEAIGPLLDFVRPLMMDQERVVHQGVGWFLREAWKKQPKPVESFLAEWKDRSPRLIFQYATEKMSAVEKARFRRAPGSRKAPKPAASRKAAAGKRR